MVARWRTAIVKTHLDEPQQATGLYRTLLGPLEEARVLQPGRYKRVVTIGSGPILDVPFAALRDSAGKCLMERYALSSSVSLGSLLQTVTPRKPQGTLLCCVYPLDRNTAPDATVWRKGFTPLPHAREEVARIMAIVPGARQIADVEAREDSVIQQMSRYAILHFATHGILNESDGLHSWLLLAPPSSAGNEPGRLEAQEILTQPLCARLAVLSACDTARGQNFGGEGLVGMAWAFRAAGCPSVVASQWRADDATAPLLMETFYKRLLAGEHKDEALRQAMSVVRKHHPQPLYWAAFEMIGDTQPLSLAAWLPDKRKSPLRH